MEDIKVNTRIDHEITVDVHIEDVIDAINNSHMKRRWNFIGKIINEVTLDTNDLNQEQKAIIKRYLHSKLALFK